MTSHRRTFSEAVEVYDERKRAMLAGRGKGAMAMGIETVEDETLEVLYAGLDLDLDEIRERAQGLLLLATTATLAGVPGPVLAFSGMVEGLVIGLLMAGTDLDYPDAPAEAAVPGWARGQRIRIDLRRTGGPVNIYRVAAVHDDGRLELEGDNRG